MPAAQMPCNNADNIGERKTWNGRKVNSAPGKTAKHRARFGWPPVSNVAAVTKAKRETR